MKFFEKLYCDLVGFTIIIFVTLSCMNALTTPLSYACLAVFVSAFVVTIIDPDIVNLLRA